MTSSPHSKQVDLLREGLDFLYHHTPAEGPGRSGVWSDAHKILNELEEQLEAVQAEVSLQIASMSRWAERAKHVEEQLGAQREALEEIAKNKGHSPGVSRSAEIARAALNPASERQS